MELGLGLCLWLALGVSLLGAVYVSDGGYSNYKVILRNECPETLFLGAAGPSVVFPLEGTWEVEFGGNITIRIPNTWLHTQNHHKRSIVGPRFWARTGCRYDISEGRAQCETGDCSSNYDCSAAKLAGKTPTSLAEFCFECGDSYTYYDVSLVDGYSVSIDIVPGRHSPTRPGDPENPFWCKHELCKPGADMRTDCPPPFLLTNDQLNMYDTSSPLAKVACFSNCGLYEYPTAPLPTCSDDDEKCSYWRQYCCQADTYGKTCTSSDDCTDGGACWEGTCQCKAYLSTPPCTSDICTNPDGQPDPGNCSSFDCVGDDTFHKTCPRAYTWPNDPQTYSCDAIVYTIVFCPGGTDEFITPVSPIPVCANLDPDLFDWKTAQQDCSEGHGKFLCAVQKTEPLNIWACDVDNTGCDGVLCYWE